MTTTYSIARVKAVKCILKLIASTNPSLAKPYDIPFSVIEADCGVDSRVLGRKEVVDAVQSDLTNSGYTASKVTINRKVHFRIGGDGAPN